MALRSEQKIKGAELVDPIQDLVSVLDQFWEEYGHRRESGLNQDDSVYSALSELLPDERCGVVIRMLNGELDWKLSNFNVSFDGQAMRELLVSTGDKYWKRVRVSPIRRSSIASP